MVDNCTMVFLCSQQYRECVPIPPFLIIYQEYMLQDRTAILFYMFWITMSLCSKKAKICVAGTPSN